MIVVALFAA